MGVNATMGLATLAVLLAALVSPPPETLALVVTVPGAARPEPDARRVQQRRQPLAGAATRTGGAALHSSSANWLRWRQRTQRRSATRRSGRRTRHVPDCEVRERLRRSSGIHCHLGNIGYGSPVEHKALLQAHQARPGTVQDAA